MGRYSTGQRDERSTSDRLDLCDTEALLRPVFQLPIALALKRRPHEPFFAGRVREKQQTCATTTSRFNNNSPPSVVALVDLAKLKAHPGPISVAGRSGMIAPSRTSRSSTYHVYRGTHAQPRPHIEDRVHPVMPIPNGPTAGQDTGWKPCPKWQGDSRQSNKIGRRSQRGC
jgi:hypothetical protein